MLRDVDGNPDPALCPTIPLAVFAMFQLKVRFAVKRSVVVCSAVV
jgi:hypothetical protein